MSVKNEKYLLYFSVTGNTESCCILHYFITYIFEMSFMKLFLKKETNFVSHSLDANNNTSIRNEKTLERKLMRA